MTDTTHNHRQTDSHTLNQYSDSLGSSFLGKNINTYDCFFCCYKGILDCYLMDSCSLNSKLQFNLIFSFIYGVWGAKIRFVLKKIMERNIGPAPRQFRCLPFILTKLTNLGSFWDTFPTGFTKTHGPADPGSSVDTFLLSVNISMCGA